MSRKLSNFMKAVVLALVCLTAVSVPAYGQGNGRWRGPRRDRIYVERFPGRGVPASIRGRGRNYYPGVPRRRYIRSTSLIRTRTIVVPRRVRRGRYYEQRVPRRSIYYRQYR